MVRIDSPAAGTVFRISSQAVFPTIDIQATYTPAAPRQGGPTPQGATQTGNAGGPQNAGVAMAMGLVGGAAGRIIGGPPGALAGAAAGAAGAAAAASFVWEWRITWRSRTGRDFTQNGTATTAQPNWRVNLNAVLGGTLRVTLRPAGTTESASVELTIRGDQPSEQEVTTYIGTLNNAVGFENILRHETRMRHFDANGEPTTAGDNGYGICQLTNPRPTYEQVCSWKRNIDAGVALYQTKQRAAIGHLTQNGRTYTNDQLVRETVSRWNGGSYHSWDGTGWVRRTDIMCDTETGNFGWDMTDPSNTGQTAEQLRDRDFPRNRAGRRVHALPGRGAHYGNYGVCYADSLLGQP